MTLHSHVSTLCSTCGYLWTVADCCRCAFNLHVFLLARNLPWSINEIINQIMNQIINWNILESSIASSIGSWIFSDAAASRLQVTMPVTAETLASKLSDCGVPLAPLAPLAAAALKVCHYHGPTAAQVIRHGLANPRDPYEYVDGLAPGPSHGDPVFKHPWVQTLLEVARDRVKQALDQQPGPAEDKWLICIRTFGRPGVRCQQSELHRFLFGVLLPCAAKILEEKLEAANLSLPALRKMAKRPLKSFQEELKKAGVGRVHPETAKRLSETLCEPLEKVEKKLNLSEKGLRELTLAALELALGPEAYKRCLIFVSHTDEAWTSGKYDAALSGTHWADRVVVGIRGAHLQAGQSGQCVSSFSVENNLWGLRDFKSLGSFGS